MRTFQRILWPLLAVLSPALLLPVYFAGNWYSFFHGYSLGMALGTVSYAWMVVVLVLCARIPYFDRLYGHDRVLVFHGYLAGAAIVAGYIHGRIKEFYLGDAALQAKLGEAALYTFLGLAVLTHLFMTGHLQRYLPFTRPFITRIRTLRLFDYSRVKLLHNVMAAALAVIIIHVLLAAPTAETTSRMWAIGGWGALGILAYLYHTVVRRIMLHRRAQRITAVTVPAPGVTRLAVSAPRTPRPVHAGQFMYLRILGNAIGTEEHPFTISSAPAGDGCVTFTAKDLGDYTARLPDVQPGSKILADGPYGIFTPERTDAPHLFIAGGIGITPFLSIISAWDVEGFAGPVTLLWSARHEADLVDRKRLENIAARHGAFTFVPVITGNGNRIDADLLGRHVRPDITAWFCGPEAMRRDMKRMLKELGIRRLHYERFSA